MRARQITARNMVLCNLFITGEGEKKKKKQSEVKKKKNKTKKKKEKKNQLNKTPAVITAGKLERQLLEPQQTFDAADCGFRSMKEGGEGSGK